MKITILGSGTLFLTKNRFPSSFLLEDKGTKMLIDCGFGAIARLAEIGIDHRDIDAIFISHFHTDHFGDCFNLVHSRFVGDIYEGRENKELLIIGPASTAERLKKWREIFWPEPKERYPIKFLEKISSNYCINSIGITTFPVVHVPWFESIGARMVVRDKIVVYPGDIGSSHNSSDLIRNSRNADLLIIEAGFEKPTPNHFTFEQIEELVRVADVKKVLISHLKTADEKRVKEFVKSRTNFIVAEDKMVIEI